MAAKMLSKSRAGGASRPGIESALALLAEAGTAAMAEATTGATAEGIGAVARAVETIEPTGPAGNNEGNNGGKRAGLAEARRAVATRERRVDSCMIVACEDACSGDTFECRLDICLSMCSLRGYQCEGIPENLFA